MNGQPTFHYLTEGDEEEQALGGLNHLVNWNAGLVQCTWKKVTIVLASGAAKNVMSKSMFLEVSTVETEIQEREGGQKKLEKQHQELWSARHVPRNSWRTCTQKHVASCRREKTICVRSHIDMFIGKEKTWRTGRRERNQCSERRRACAVYVGERRHCANQVHSPWQSIKLQTGENKGSKWCTTATNHFLMSREVIEEDRNKWDGRQNTWRTERLELTAESAKVWNIRDPGQPTTLRPCRSWCKFCTAWCEFVAQGVGCSWWFRRGATCVDLLLVPWLEVWGPGDSSAGHPWKEIQNGVGDVGRSLISLGTQCHTQMWRWQWESHKLVKWPEHRKLHLSIVVASKSRLMRGYCVGWCSSVRIFKNW